MRTALLQRDQSNCTIFTVAAHKHKKDVSSKKSDVASEWVTSQKKSSDSPNMRRPTETHCNTLQHITSNCHAVPCPLTDRHTLQHAATQCSTLQHTATHYNILQYTSTHLLWPEILRLSVQMQHTAATTSQNGAVKRRSEVSLHCNTLEYKRRNFPVSIIRYASWIEKFLDLFTHIFDASSKCSWISCGSLYCSADGMSRIFAGPFCEWVCCCSVL